MQTKNIVGISLSVIAVISGLVGYFKTDYVKSSKSDCAKNCGVWSALLSKCIKGDKNCKVSWYRRPEFYYGISVLSLMSAIVIVFFMKSKKNSVWSSEEEHARESRPFLEEEEEEEDFPLPPDESRQIGNASMIRDLSEEEISGDDISEISAEQVDLP